MEIIIFMNQIFHNSTHSQLQWLVTSILFSALLFYHGLMLTSERDVHVSFRVVDLYSRLSLVSPHLYR